VIVFVYTDKKSNYPIIKKRMLSIIWKTSF